MTALYDAAYYYGNMNTNFDYDDFKVISELLPSCYLMLSHCEGIKLPTNSVPAIFW